MISPAALEEAVLCLLCFSNEQAPSLALRVRDSSLFKSFTNRRLAEASLNFVKQYNTAPGAQLEYILEADLRRGEEGKLLGQTINILRKQVTQIQPSFVLEELDNFIESQTLSTSLQDALELISTGDLQKAKEVVFSQSTTQKIKSPGIWLKKPEEALSFLQYQDSNEFFSSGIAVLDRREVVPERKTLSFMIASSGKGKTWWLVEVGKSGLQYHHNVLHITLEISERKTARRYIQSIFSLTKSETQQVTVPFFTQDSGATKIEFETLTRDPILARKKQIQNRLQDMFSYPDILIKEFPTSTFSTEQLSLYMESLDRDRGFRPDLVIIDYADLMKIDAQALRVDTGRLYRELRGIAVNRNFALVTATQGNRHSEDAKLVSKTDVSEDWSKIGTADIVLTYSQTPEEARLGLARVFVAKARDAADRFIVLISQAYECGQFCLDSMQMNVDVLNEVQRIGGGEEKT